MTRKNRSFDPRRHRQQTQVRLIVGGMLALLVVGGALVWAFYGRAAAFTAAACLLAASGVMGLLWVILAVLERWARDDEP